jgi:hypothetical protein
MARRSIIVWGFAVFSGALLLVAVPRGEAEEVDNPRPREARVVGDTWCGPVTRQRNEPIYAVYADLARYFDAGATVVSHSRIDALDSETFVLCGTVRGRNAQR